jgi:hypothetical protein
MENLVVQYGSFGLVAALLIWSVKWGIPSMISAHREAMADLADSHRQVCEKLVVSFDADVKDCREERRSIQKGAAEEREKDRAAREEMTQAVIRLTTQLSRAEDHSDRKEAKEAENLRHHTP